MQGRGGLIFHVVGNAVGYLIGDIPEILALPEVGRIFGIADKGDFRQHCRHFGPDQHVKGRLLDAQVFYLVLIFIQAGNQAVLNILRQPG